MTLPGAKVILKEEKNAAVFGGESQDGGNDFEETEHMVYTIFSCGSERDADRLRVRGRRWRRKARRAERARRRRKSGQSMQEKMAAANRTSQKVLQQQRVL